MRIAVVSWMYGSAWTVLVSGIQLKTFARLLGFSDFDFGLLAAVPPVATMFMLLAAVLIERTGLRKYQFLEFGTVHRLLWLLIAAIPLAFMVPSRQAVWMMLLVYSVSWVMHSFAAPAWTTWMGDIVPKRIRGRFFATRFGFGRLIQIVLVVGIGILLDEITLPMEAGQVESVENQPYLLWATMGIFAVAALLGATEILMYRKVRDIMPRPTEDQERPHQVYIPRPKRWTPFSAIGFGGLYVHRFLAEVLVEPMKDPVFRNYVKYGFTVAFATSVPGFFFWVYTTESLGFSKLAANVLYMVISPILGMIGLQVWGRLLDRWGRRPVLMVSTGMTVFSVTPYFFTTRHTPAPQFVLDACNWIAAHVGPMVGKGGDWVWLTSDMPIGAFLLVSISVTIGGIGWTGVMMGQNNFMLAFSDSKGRSRYVAAAQVLVSLGAVIGAPVGGLLVWGLGAMNWNALAVGPFIWLPYHATFALSCASRILALIWLINLPDPGAGKVRDMIRYMGLITYSNLSSWVLFPVRVLKHKK